MKCFIIDSVFLRSNSVKSVHHAFSGMLRLAAQKAEHLAQTYLGGVVAPQLRELLLHTIEHLVAAQPGTFILSLGQLIAVANQSLQAVLAPLVGEVIALDASHFGVAEPVGHLIHLQLMLQLCKELRVVNGSLVVDELPLRFILNVSSMNSK